MAEVKRLRARVAQGESDVERLRRDLTAEQFERERCSQELRRVQKFDRMHRAVDMIENLETPRQHSKFSPSMDEYKTHSTQSAKETSELSHLHSLKSLSDKLDKLSTSNSSTELGAMAKLDTVDRREKFKDSKMSSGHLSSSSDTGLERSQAANSSESTDSQREPWKLAFGSNKLFDFDTKTKSRESVGESSHRSNKQSQNATGQTLYSSRDETAYNRNEYSVKPKRIFSTREKSKNKSDSDS